MSEQQSEQLEEEQAERVVLDAEGAFELLYQGVDSWNKWVEENPRADVFVEIEGYFHRSHIDSKIINGEALLFKKLNLPEGTLRITSNNLNVGLDFTGADLSQTTLDLSGFETHRNVNLAGCQLADGMHNFEDMNIVGIFNCSNVDFGNEPVSFHQSIFQGGFNLENAIFGDGDKDFSRVIIHREFNTFNTNFGDGLVSFANAHISQSSLNLSHSIFDNVYLNLDSARCANGVDISGKTLANGSSFKQLIVNGGLFNAQSTQFADGLLSFEGAQFNDCEANFIHVKFGKGTVSFKRVRFGRGARFDKAIFQQGNKSFLNCSVAGGEFNLNGTIFGEGDISFVNTTFESAWLDLSQSAIGKANIDFNDAKLHQGLNLQKLTIDGSVSFINMHIVGGQFNAKETTFSDGDISFEGAIFSQGTADFTLAEFGKGDISFNQAEFNKGVAFNDARFGQGDKSFVGIKVGKESFDATKAQFNNGNVDFHEADFQQSVVFDDAVFGVGQFRISDGSLNDAQFNNVDFSHCDVAIANSQFTGEAVVFNHSRIKSLRIVDVVFIAKQLSFSHVTIDTGNINLLKPSTKVKRINFEAANLTKTEIYMVGHERDNFDVYFDNAELSGCILDFENTWLKGNRFSFKSVTAHLTSINFEKSELLYDSIEFNNTSLVDSRFNLSHATFRCDVAFNNMQITDQSKIDFTSATFEKEVSFKQATISASKMDFYKTRFEKAYVDFQQINTPNASLNFEYTHFGGNVSFAKATDTNSMRLLSFKFASFEGSFDLTDLQFGCVVDLTHTKFTNQVALDGVRCALPREKRGHKLVAQDKQDTGRLRRLKEIAENNKDHQQALHFHADEMRAKRWNEHSNSQSVLDLSFDVVSEYGQSILRPFVVLVAMFTLLVGLFSMGAPAIKVDDGRSGWSKAPIGHAANLVLSNTMPFLTTSKASKEKSMQVLFGYKPAGWVYIVLSIHTALSLVFLFLMGLGFRNRFRI